MEAISPHISLSFGFAFLVYIWCDTEAFVEYCSLLGLNLFHSEEFLERKKKMPSLDYISFLQFEKSSFMVRLVTCPICLSAWLNILSFVGFSITNVTLSSFLINSYFTVLFYLILKKMTDLSNQ